jgi:heme exporter protein A
MLTVVDLACVRGERLLFRDLSFSVPAGGLLHVQGANGSGKTSLLRLLTGLTTPARGVIRWRDRPIRELGNEYWRELHYLGHSNGVKEDLDAVENLLIASRLAGDNVSKDRVREVLQDLELGESLHLPARLLSHGQKRRIALSRLLLSEKPLWVLDEPFAALDASFLLVLRGVLEAHLARGGLAVLTTHQEIPIEAVSRQALGLGA